MDCKIIGNPGVGKTTLIIHKVLHHLKTGELRNEKSFLIAAFTNNARQEFIERSRSVGGGDYFCEKNVLTLHKLAGRMYTKKDMCDNGTLLHATTLEIRERTVEELRRIPMLRRLKAIIVDEAQDISDVQYEFLMEMKKKLGCFLILIGDPNQNIFQFQGGSDRFLLAYKAPEYHLTVNNRSVPGIVDFANCFRPNQSLPHMEASRGGGGSSRKPVHVYNLSPDRMMDKVMELIRSLGRVDLSEVAIIGPVKKSRKQGQCYKNIGLSMFENLMARHKIPFVQHYASGGRRRNYRCKGKINLHTIHSSKGDEFHTVILINFHFFTQGVRPTQEMYEQFRYLWWTGITRAKDRLHLMMDETKQYWPDLEDVPSALYRFSGTAVRRLHFEPAEPDDMMRRWTVSEVLDNVRNHDLYKMHCLLSYTMPVAPPPPTDEDEEEDYPFIEAHLRMVFFYLAHRRLGKESRYIKSLQAPFKHRMTIPTMFRRACRKMFGYTNEVTPEQIRRYEPVDPDEAACRLFMIGAMTGDKASYKLNFEDDLVFRDDAMMYRIVAGIDDKTYFRSLFLLALYQYQFENEQKHMWSLRDDLLRGQEKYLPHIRSCVDALVLPGVRFHRETKHPVLDMVGTVDVWSDKGGMHAVVFQKELQTRTIHDLLLNHNNQPAAAISVWNLYDNRRYPILPAVTDRNGLVEFLRHHLGQKTKTS